MLTYIFIKTALDIIEISLCYFVKHVMSLNNYHDHGRRDEDPTQHFFLLIKGTKIGTKLPNLRIFL